MSFFINTPYRLVIRTNIDLSSATSITVKYNGPYYEAGEWPATAEVKNAIVNINDTLIDRRGTYKIQVITEIDGDINRSSFASINFID